MRGIRSYMGWTHIPHMDASSATSDDNPFAGPKTQTPGKVSVQVHTNDWLCKKLNKLNLTLVEGYPSQSLEAGGFLMQAQLKTIQTESKGTGSSIVSAATYELQYLMDFNSSVTQALVKSMEHLTDFVFVSMGNLTLARRDSYLTHVKSGITPDTLSALRTVPLQLSTVFPDSILKQAKDDIASSENTLHTARVGTIPMNIPIKSLTKDPTNPHGRILVKKDKAGNTRVGHLTTLPDQPRGTSHINDNYCVQTGLLARSKQTVQCFSTPRTPGKTLDIQTPRCQIVDFTVENHVLSVLRQSQKKDVTPAIVNRSQQKELKYVKYVSYVAQLSFVKPVTNVQPVVTNLPVGARLQNFWKTWLDLGAGLKIVQILREGYTFPFRTRPNLAR